MNVATTHQNEKNNHPCIDLLLCNFLYIMCINEQRISVFPSNF